MIYKGIINNSFGRSTRRKLRVDQTDEELKLWQELRNRKLGVKFRRQYGINNYVLDFYCPDLRLNIEIDGKDHLTQKGKRKDLVRDTELKGMGIEVMRFWGSQVRSHVEEVLDIIRVYLTSGPSPYEGEGKW